MIWWKAPLFGSIFGFVGMLVAVPTLVTYEMLAAEGASLGFPADSVAKIDSVRLSGLKSLEIMREAGLHAGLWDRVLRLPMGFFGQRGPAANMNILATAWSDPAIGPSSPAASRSARARVT